jgi:hypothetical protein
MSVKFKTGVAFAAPRFAGPECARYNPWPRRSVPLAQSPELLSRTRCAVRTEERPSAGGRFSMRPSDD